MNPGICSEELQDCTITGLSDSMLWRKLLRRVGNCFSLNISGTVSALPSSTERSWTSEQWANDTVNTTVAAGSRTVMFETSEDFAGSINGITRLPSRSYTFSVIQNDDTQGAIVCVVTAGTLNVDTLI